MESTKNIQDKDQWEAAFLEACQDGNIEDIERLLEKQFIHRGWVHIHGNREYGFHLACSNGNLEVVKYLLTSPKLAEEGHAWANVHEDQDLGFRWACRYGQWNVVRWLVMDYGIKKTPDIEEIIKDYPQAQEYFRARQEQQEIQSTLGYSSPKTGKTSNGPGEEGEKKDERAAKKAKKL